MHIISCIFGLMKKHFKLLLSTDFPEQGKYTNIKNLIMKCIKRYLKMNNPSKSITKDIADCLSIIILSGVFYHWTNVISDLIQESYTNSNLTLYYLVLLALADIDILIHYNKTEEESYSNPLIISNGERMKIKDKLFNNSEIVMKYIIFIFKGIKDFSGDENKKNLFINALLDCIRCWSNFKLNILKHLDLAKIAYYIMNNFLIENPNKFSYLVMECISNSDNSKVYQSIDTDKNSTPEQLSEIIFKSINNDEKKGLDLLLEFLSPNLEYFKRINPEEMPENKRKLFISYMRILSAIMENYIYFFFNFSDERSGKMLEYFQYFLMYKKRRISSFFIEGLGEMRNFINNFYRFYGLNDEQSLKAAVYHREYGSNKAVYEAKLYSGVADTLVDLSKQGYILAVATLKRQDIAERILSLYDIGGYFAHIAGMNHAETDSKSGLIKRVCAMENIVPGDAVLMVGDSQYDYEGAKEAGVDFLGVSYGYGFEGTEEGIYFVGDFVDIKFVVSS